MVAAGLAMSLQLMSLLVQQPVDTRGSAHKLEDDSMETGIAEIRLRLYEALNETTTSKFSTAGATFVSVLKQVTLSLQGSHIK